MNSRILVAAVAISISAFTGAACSDDDDGPSGLPTTFVFTSTLNAANEVPPVTNAGPNPAGTLTLTMTVTRDAGGAITAATSVFVVNMTGFTAGTTVTAAHVHNNVAGQNAGIFLDTGLGGAVVLANGTGSFTQTAPLTSVAQANAIIANPAGHYFNVHTTNNPGGAIRGQLALQ